MKETDAFVSHCGMNSVSESLYFEVPLVLFPQATEQKGVAERFRLRGKGVPFIRGKGRGDQYVTVTVEVPKNLSSKQKELLKEFDEDKNYKQKKSFADKMKEFLK